MVRHGNIHDHAPENPNVGNTRRMTPNSKTKSAPTKNVGIDAPTKATPRVTLTIGGERFTGTACLVSDANEMAHVVDLLKRKYWLARPYLWIKKRPAGAFRVDLDATS